MKKLGSQLTTGDVVVHRMPLGEPERRVVLGTRSDVAGSIFVIYGRGDIAQSERTNHFHCMSNDEFTVEDRGGVTADELHLLVKAARQVLEMAGDHPSIIDHDTYTGLTALVERLAPVVPPTLNEMLGILDVLVATPDLGRAAACDILNRARQAGML